MQPVITRAIGSIVLATVLLTIVLCGPAAGQGKKSSKFQNAPTTAWSLDEALEQLKLLTASKSWGGGNAEEVIGKNKKKPK